jgi:mRNA interferase RelE/StbE
LAYTVILKPAAIKELDGLQKKDRQKVAAKIDSLQQNATPIGSKKLAGKDGLYRLRFGDYRIIYTAPDENGVIRVLKIAHRGDVYNML